MLASQPQREDPERNTSLLECASKDVAAVLDPVMWYFRFGRPCKRGNLMMLDVSGHHSSPMGFRAMALQYRVCQSFYTPYTTKRTSYPCAAFSFAAGISNKRS